MKLSYKIIVLFIFCGLEFSCEKSPYEKEKEHILKMLQNIELTSDIKWVVILPGLGCHGCIQEGEVFLAEHTAKKDIFIILTSVESVKILQNKLGIDIHQSENVYLDNDNAFMLPTENKIYPCIIWLKSGKYASHEFQSPENNAFEKLGAMILSE